MVVFPDFGQNSKVVSIAVNMSANIKFGFTLGRNNATWLYRLLMQIGIVQWPIKLRTSDLVMIVFSWILLVPAHMALNDRQFLSLWKHERNKRIIKFIPLRFSPVLEGGKWKWLKWKTFCQYLWSKSYWYGSASMDFIAFFNVDMKFVFYFEGNLEGTHFTEKFQVFLVCSIFSHQLLTVIQML